MKTDFVVKRSSNYTLINNEILSDKNLTLKSLGLLCKMLSLSPEWDYSFNGLVAICRESKAAVTSALKELKNAGYVDIIESRNKKGQFVYNYEVYDLPKPLYLKQIHPLPDFRGTDNPLSVNQKQLNTNKVIDKIDKTSDDENHSIFTKELIRMNYIDSNEYNLCYYDNLFREYELAGYTKQDLNISIHYIVSRVISNKFKDEYGYPIENKFGYFKSALESNFIKMNSSYSYDDEYDWINDTTDDRER